MTHNFAAGAPRRAADPRAEVDAALVSFLGAGRGTHARGVAFATMCYKIIDARGGGRPLDPDTNEVFTAELVALLAAGTRAAEVPSTLEMVAYMAEYYQLVGGWRWVAHLARRHAAAGEAVRASIGECLLRGV